MERRSSEGVGSRLRAARLAARFKTGGDAAAALGITPPTYYAHENGNRKVSSDRVVAYAQIFGVSVEWLLLGKGVAPAREPSGMAATSPASASPRTTAIPISGEARRGAFFEENRRRTGLGEAEVEFPPDLPSAGLFAIRMADKSMDWLFPEGGLLVCRRVNWGAKPEHAPDGEIVVVETKYAGLLEQTVAQIQREGGKVHLRYLSSDFSLGGICDFEPERPPRRHPTNPFLQYHRKILGVVLTDIRTLPPRELRVALESSDHN